MWYSLLIKSINLLIELFMENEPVKKSFFVRVFANWKVWAAVIVLVIIVSVLDTPNSINKQQNNVNSTKTETNILPTPTTTITKVTTENLLKEYEANEVAADEKYKSKLVEITGTVYKIDKDIFETPQIRFSKNNTISSVVCSFSKNNTDQLSKVSIGQSLNLKGTVKGMTLGSVYLKDCSF